MKKVLAKKDVLMDEFVHGSAQGLTRGIVKSNNPLELFLTPGSEVRPKNFKKLFNPLNYIGSIFLISYFLA